MPCDLTDTRLLPAGARPSTLPEWARRHLQALVRTYGDAVRAGAWWHVVDMIEAYEERMAIVLADGDVGTVDAERLARGCATRRCG